MLVLVHACLCTFMYAIVDFTLLYILKLLRHHITFKQK